MQKKPTYLDVVANSASAAKAWRAAAMLLACLSGYLSFTLVSTVRNTPVVLVPFDLATNGTERLTVSTNGEIRGTSFEYLANMGLSDLTLILNFTPDNVITQHQRFLNRTTEELYGQQREMLLAQAAEYKSRSTTQSFYVSNIRVSKDFNSVEVEGSQVRWVGGKETLRTNVTYVLTYRFYKGYMHVSDLRQKNEADK